MQHFLTIDDLSVVEVQYLIHRALAFKKGAETPNFDKYRLAMLFYENSTRTRISFEVAAQNLSIPIIHFDNVLSSESKGESFEDTIANLIAMGIQLFIIRHKQDYFFNAVLKRCPPKVHLINAGDGRHEHPSQALLDLMTILAHKPDLSKLKVVIIGNISHSRVANSLMRLFQLMQLKELVLVAPTIWQPRELAFGRITDSLEEGLYNADIVICLRIQKERLVAEEEMEVSTYKALYSVTAKRLSSAKSDVVIMHPGPVNRGLELDAELADARQSLILEQVANGVFMRMAIIEALLAKS